jgi:hypothetical protein
MFEVRRGSRRTAEHGRIERAATRGEQRERSETATDLETKVVDVIVRHAIACEMDERPKQQRHRPRARERANRRAGGDVE